MDGENEVIEEVCFEGVYQRNFICIKDPADAAHEAEADSEALTLELLQPGIVHDRGQLCMRTYSRPITTRVVSPVPWHDSDITIHAPVKQRELLSYIASFDPDSIRRHHIVNLSCKSGTSPEWAL